MGERGPAGPTPNSALVYMHLRLFLLFKGNNLFFWVFRVFEATFFEWNEWNHLIFSTFPRMHVSTLQLADRSEERRKSQVSDSIHEHVGQAMHFWLHGNSKWDLRRWQTDEYKNVWLSLIWHCNILLARRSEPRSGACKHEPFSELGALHSYLHSY